MFGEAKVFTAGKAFLVRALRKSRKSNEVIYQATANNTFNGTFASAGQFAVRYRSLYRKSATTCKGPLTRR